MDWRRTKTIFIITFLILNVFLVFQILEKRKNNQLEILAEASMEEQFKVDEISYGQLPKAPDKASYISGNSYVFTEEDIKKLMDKGQKAEVVEDISLIATWEEPIPLPEMNMITRLETIFKEELLFGEKYEFWGFNPQNRSLVFFQQYDGKNIYSNDSAMVVAYLNELNELISYEQTYIVDTEKMDVEQDVISVLDALYNLYNTGDLKPGSEVGNVQLGYYTLVDYTNSHVLIPTWHIVVNEEEDFYVNAFEGSVIKKDKRTTLE